MRTLTLASALLLFSTSPYNPTSPHSPTSPHNPTSPHHPTSPHNPTSPHSQTPRPIPEVVSANWARMIGTWVTDNAAHVSASEPAEQYAIDWSWGLGRQSMVGRLYGLKGGKEIGTYWEFREFWHPGDGRLIIQQFGGGGAFGAGWHEVRADGTSEMLQTFYDPSGRTTLGAHRSTLDGDTHTTHSFDVAADGTWTARRTYVWKRRR